MGSSVAWFCGEVRRWCLGSLSTKQQKTVKKSFCTGFSIQAHAIFRCLVLWGGEEVGFRVANKKTTTTTATTTTPTTTTRTMKKTICKGFSIQAHSIFCCLVLWRGEQVGIVVHKQSFSQQAKDMHGIGAIEANSNVTTSSTTTRTTRTTRTTTKKKNKRLDERACLQVDTGQQQSHENIGVWGLGIRV